MINDKGNAALNNQILEYLRQHEYRCLAEISEDLGVDREHVRRSVNYLCADRRLHAVVGWNRNARRLTYYRLATGPECSILKLLDQ